ncbi:MAG: hypothetical protein KDI71_01115 [Xanthomonadales bacterium]|nr:hypothetical protein [Xanthomonadales bacterium]
MKTALKILGGLVAFIAIVIGLAFWATGGVTEAGDQFLTALSKGENEQAYQLTSKAFQQSARPEQLAIFAKTYGLDRIRTTSWSSRSFENNSGKLVGSATLDDGSEISLEIELIHEDEAWKILHVSSKSGRAESAAEAASTSTQAPDAAQSQALVRRSMADFAASVNAGEMSQFRASTSALWQEQFDLQRFNDSYASIIDTGVDLTQLDPMTPLLSQAGAINSDGVLVLAGHYESEPNQVYFEHKYIDEGGQWKLVGFNIEMK